MTQDELELIVGRFDRIEARISAFEVNVERRFELLDARLATLESGQARLESEFSLLRKDNRRLEEKVNVFIEEVIALSREVRRAADAA